MRRMLISLLVLLAFASTPAFGQATPDYANVVTICGITNGAPYLANQNRPRTQDTNGNDCVTGTFTGTVTANQGTAGGTPWPTNDANTQAAISAAALTSLPPGTNQIGTVSGSNVGGYEFNTTSIPTIQNAAYASGNCMGGFNALTVARTNGGGIILDTFGLRSVGGGTTAIQVYIFNANPSASTCTDKSTFTINSADIDKIIAGGTFQLIPAAVTGTSITFAYQSNMALSTIAGGSSGSGVQTIYYALVSAGTWTPASTTDLHVQVNGIQD